MPACISISYYYSIFSVFYPAPTSGNVAV